MVTAHIFRVKKIRLPRKEKFSFTFTLLVSWGLSYNQEGNDIFFRLMLFDDDDDNEMK